MNLLPRSSARLLLALVLALAMPAAASAQGVSLPPGNSEADQYFETVPNGTGDSSPDTTRPPEEVLSAEQIADLEALGPGGQAAAELAAATAPEGSVKAGAGGGNGGPDGGGGSEADSNVAPTAAIPSRDGLGGLLWLIVIGAALAALIFAVMRRRADQAL